MEVRKRFFLQKSHNKVTTPSKIQVSAVRNRQNSDGFNRETNKGPARPPALVRWDRRSVFPVSVPFPFGFKHHLLGQCAAFLLRISRGKYEPRGPAEQNLWLPRPCTADVFIHFSPGEISKMPLSHRAWPQGRKERR